MQKIMAMTLAVALPLSVTAANAADNAPYPNRPIRLLNPFAPGGTVDINARVLAAEVAKQLGGNIVIDNRDGANGIVGTQIVVNAPPDGYTFLHTSTSIAINPSVYRKMPYDALKDLVPITFVALSAGYVVVAHPGFAARSMKDVIAKPVAYSRAGIGNSTHLVTEMFNGAAGITMTHVPYKGVAPALNAVLAGEVQLMFIPPTSAVQHIQSGRARALAYTGKARWSVLPDVPTVAESGLPGFSKDAGWNLWAAPAKTPPAIVARLQKEANKALQLPHVREAFVKGGYDPLGNTPEEARAFLAAEIKLYSDIVKKIGLKPE